MGLIQRTIEVAELVLGHAYQLPQRLAFIEQESVLVTKVHLPACLMIRSRPSSATFSTIL